MGRANLNWPGLRCGMCHKSTGGLLLSSIFVSTEKGKKKKMEGQGDFCLFLFLVSNVVETEGVD